LLKSKGFLTQEKLAKKPYYADFVMLEILDSIWINEVYTKCAPTLLTKAS